MYYRHFGLDGAPFRFVPSPRELFLSQSHREGLAALEWGVLHEPSGFTVLIGEAGAGKTTLVKSILARNHARVRAACISNPKRGFEGILRELVRQFGLATLPIKLDMLAAFDQFLERLRPGERIVILIDEAQSLDDESLEELRLFSNGGSAEEKQLHFVLVGQPELMQRLMKPGLRQFNDRIGARALLKPLSAGEARAYLEFRLKAHGGTMNRIFEPAAIDHILSHSNGIPRRINVLAHNAMLLAYSAGYRRVDFKSARSAAAEYENLLGDTSDGDGKRRVGVGWRHLGLAAAAMAGLLAIIVIAAGLADGPRDSGINFAGDIALKPHTPALTGGFAPANPQAAETTVPVTAPVEPKFEKAPSGTSRPDEAVAVAVSRAPSVASAGRPQRHQIRVRYGDTLQNLAIRYLGSHDRLQSLLDANPQLRNFNLIYPGQTVYLPDSAS